MLWCHDLTKAKSRVKVDADKIYLSLGCCSFLCGGSLVVDLLFMYFPLFFWFCGCLSFGMQYFVSFLVLQSS